VATATEDTESAEQEDASIWFSALSMLSMAESFVPMFAGLINDHLPLIVSE
jgi:hypothetical protein